MLSLVCGLSTRKLVDERAGCVDQERETMMEVSLGNNLAHPSYRFCVDGTCGSFIWCLRGDIYSFDRWIVRYYLLDLNSTDEILHVFHHKIKQCSIQLSIITDCSLWIPTGRWTMWEPQLPWGNEIRQKYLRNIPESIYDEFLWFYCDFWRISCPKFTENLPESIMFGGVRRYISTAHYRSLNLSHISVE